MTVRVEVYGQSTTVKHVGFTSWKPNHPLSIKVYDPSIIDSIVQGIKKYGFESYVAAKDVIHVSVPPMSGDEREKSQRHVRKIAEEAKIAIRNLRKHTRQDILKSKMSETEKSKLEKNLQENVDVFIKDIDTILSNKIEELQ